MNNLTWEQIQAVEAAHSEGKTVFINTIYIDIGGDLAVGAFLHRLIWWFLPGKGGNPKTRVVVAGEPAVVKRHDEWWNEIRITAKQAQRACGICRSLGIFRTESYKFGDRTATHYFLNKGRFVELFNKALSENLVSEVIRDDTKGEVATTPKGRSRDDQKVVSSITEKNTERNTKEKTSARPKTRTYKSPTEILKRAGEIIGTALTDQPAPVSKIIESAILILHSEQNSGEIFDIFSGKERDGLSGIIKKASLRTGLPETDFGIWESIRKKLNLFRTLIFTGEDFWQKQPATLSSFNSLYDRIIESALPGAAEKRKSESESKRLDEKLRKRKQEREDEKMGNS